MGMSRLVDGGASVIEASRLVHQAVDSGLYLLDTADIYGFDSTGGFGDAEELLGQVLSGDPALKASFVIATKGGIRPPDPYDSSSGYLSSAIHDSLKRLRVDRIDLWQIHRPDILAHPHETAGCMEDALVAGKCAQSAYQILPNRRLQR